MRTLPTLWTVGTLAALAFFLVFPASAASPANSPDATTLGPDEARRRLTADCDFFQNLTLFDLEIRLQKKLKPADHAHGLEELKELIRQSVAPWKPAEASAIQSAADKVVRQVRSLYPAVSMPTIGLVKTTGREEGDAAYTRGSCIVIPQSMLGRDLTDVLAHELFHVISRHNPEIRQRLYKVIGFSKVASFVPPDSLRHITNPDGVDYLWSVRVKADGRPIEALPLIYSQNEYDGGGLFNYVAFGFLELQGANNRYTAKLDSSGRPVLLEPRQLQGLFEQTGRNTAYLIHPDEILADNFKLLLAYKAPERRSTIAARYDTKLLDRIDAVLKEDSSRPASGR